MKGAAVRLPIAAGVFILVELALAPGCVTAPGVGYLGGWDTDVSDRAELWGRYDPDAVYRLERDVFLMEIPDQTTGLALVPGADASVPPDTPRGPVSIERYEGPAGGWPGVRGVVPEGTRVRAFVLRAKGNLRDPGITRHYVKGRILHGPHQGVVVDLEPVSIYRTDPDTGRVILVGPNDDLLLRIT